MQHLYQDWTNEELRARNARLPAPIPILPLAAIESHGPHLPLGTDAILAGAMIDRVVGEVDEAWPGLFLPVQSFGVSTEHTGFCGTIDLGWRAMAETIAAIGWSLRRSGFERMVIVNAHGGNAPMMAQAALDLRAETGVLAATCSWLRFGYPEGLLPQDEIDDGIHGGAVETSLMLHVRPDLVRREQIADFASRQTTLRGQNEFLTAHGRLGYNWMTGDLNPSGAVGNASLATAAIGAAIAGHQARAFIRFVEEWAAFRTTTGSDDPR